jgi:hypothetical protein
VTTTRGKNEVTLLMMVESDFRLISVSIFGRDPSSDHAWATKYSETGEQWSLASHYFVGCLRNFLLFDETFHGQYIENMGSVLQGVVPEGVW